MLYNFWVILCSLKLIKSPVTKIYILPSMFSDQFLSSMFNLLNSSSLLSSFLQEIY